MKQLFIFLTLFGISGAWAQVPSVTISGTIVSKTDKTVLPYVNVVLKAAKDSSFISGTATNEKGQFVLTAVKPGNYVLQLSYIGYFPKKQPLFVGSLSAFLDLTKIELEPNSSTLKEVVVTGTTTEVGSKMDKKTYSVESNINQRGGSVLQAMQNLPGVSVQEGKVQLRGNDKVTILIDGRQTALTGFGTQTGLDNLAASAIEKIEIINNPSSKYDANGNAGIINII